MNTATQKKRGPVPKKTYNSSIGVLRTEIPFMPLKLRAVLAKHLITQADFARAIKKSDGTSISVALASLLLGRDQWPSRTSRDWIKKQVRDFLHARGVPEADDPDLFDLDKDPEAQLRPVTTPGIFLQRAPKEVSTPVVPVVPDEVPDYHMEPVMLTPQAKRHFKLFRDPFNTDPECAEDLFRGPDQQYAAEAIWEAVRNSRLFALVGESGSGKSTLMDDFKERVRKEELSVRLIQPMLPEKQKLTGTGILEAIIRDMAPNATLRARAEGLARQAHELLAEASEAGQHCVLIFEEAHDLSLHAIKQLKRFHEFKTGWKRLLSIVLVGQPELLTKLGEHATGEAREVARRLEIVQLLPLDNELEGYVAHKLMRANSAADKIFSADTYDAVRVRLRSMIKSGTRAGDMISMTYPLLVNNLLVKALNTAAELGANTVDGAIVKGL